MKLSTIFLFISGLLVISTSVNADSRKNRASWKVEGQTNRIFEDDFVKESYARRPLSYQSGAPLATGSRRDAGYEWIRRICYIGGELGYKLSIKEPTYYETLVFADKSSLTLQLESSNLCEVTEPQSGPKFGLFEENWIVISGTKRYEEVSGMVNVSGSYTYLWSSEVGSSQSYEGSAQLVLD